MNKQLNDRLKVAIAVASASLFLVSCAQQAPLPEPTVQKEWTPPEGCPVIDTQVGIAHCVNGDTAGGSDGTYVYTTHFVSKQDCVQLTVWAENDGYGVAYNVKADEVFEMQLTSNTGYPITTQTFQCDN